MNRLLVSNYTVKSMIHKFPPSIPYNATFKVETNYALNIHKVSLIRTSSTTITTIWINAVFFCPYLIKLVIHRDYSAHKTVLDAARVLYAIFN
jgi:hypothetical protein